MEADRRHDASTTYLFTVALADDHYGALTEHVDTLRLAFRACRDRYAFNMTAGVILPDHLHCILTLSPDDALHGARWRLIKGLFERVLRCGQEIWKPGHEERRVADEAELASQINRIHSDPVRHGLVRCPRDWPYSSFHAYVAHGLRPAYWHEDADDRDHRFVRRAA
jgi:putative transposase